MNAAIASWLSSRINCQQIFPVTSVGQCFCQQSFFPGSRRQRKNDSKKRGIMGHYTIRTNDDEDQAIKKAQEATGQASKASKTFMTAILELQRNRDEMAQLRRELAQEKARSQGWYHR
ncbi:hypothetical protein [Klebsiella pneumoniae]|uniref:hypothetical protein n=1 Tax=Klebsiella pneumoniae TaxID=573 RepID=UPI00294A7B1C|nr:hypothetical protein [Klebsiella pneumoniae]MDV5417917.1 hypothetical protein [Klebsiella pneumoniae]